MSILKSEKKELLYTGIVYLLIGVVMCTWPFGAAGVMSVLAGLTLIVLGMKRAAVYFTKKEYGLMQRLDFAAAAILVIIGIVIAGQPDFFLLLVPFILGMIILVNGVFLLQEAVELKKMKYDAWWHHLAAGFATGIAALIMMFDPFSSHRVMAVVMGVLFILDGAADLYTELFLKGRLKKLGLM
ncbi:MAG: DUF308 domain-containing protein [Clostridia bacterium]|nr:DUF308 domain-containing protein [Clostridia bacterium]